MTKDTKEAPREIWAGQEFNLWSAFKFRDDDVRYVRADTVESGEAVARIKSADEYGPIIEWTRHWVDLIGKKLYIKP
jgi:hypothetical protein